MHHDHNETLKRACIGAVAGVAGTLVMQLVRTLNEKYLPETMTESREDPGKFMVHQAERLLPGEQRRQVPRKAELAAATSLHFSYGAMFGALYGAIRTRALNPILEGALLGIGVWAAGYLGWLPAVGLTKPVWREDPQRSTAEVARHAMYGVATAAAFEAMHQNV
jgi:uncharacterized membrane protein YagU involved in acid resistance